MTIKEINSLKDFFHNELKEMKDEVSDVKGDIKALIGAMSRLEQAVEMQQAKSENTRDETMKNSNKIESICKDIDKSFEYHRKHFDNIDELKADKHENITSKIDDLSKMLTAKLEAIDKRIDTIETKDAKLAGQISVWKFIITGITGLLVIWNIVKEFIP
jgi:chromosome segregation ATPase